MRYLPNTPAQQKEMLRTIGVSSVEELLSPIPAKARLSRPLTLPAALAEADLVRHLRGLAALNADADEYVCFLGGGRLRPLHPEPHQPSDLAGGVLHRLHAVPTGGEPGDAPDDLRVPEPDGGADGDGRGQQIGRAHV